MHHNCPYYSVIWSSDYLLNYEYAQNNYIYKLFLLLNLYYEDKLYSIAELFTKYKFPIAFICARELDLFDYLDINIISKYSPNERSLLYNSLDSSKNYIMVYSIAYDATQNYSNICYMVDV